VKLFIEPVDSKILLISFYHRKNEYENATDQYCKTIGFLEPSYVIKKVNNSFCIYQISVLYISSLVS
jgi:hypothetical protein